MTKNETKKFLSNYNIVKTIGEGNFGKVKLAVCKESNKKVAIKFIDHSKLRKDPNDFYPKFRREMDIHQSLDHPNIVKLYEVIEAPQINTTCLVMEYLEGPDLLEYTLSKPSHTMSPDQIAKVFPQILSAVDYLHEKGICHRDIKLENIMVDRNGENPKLIDFGLANWCKENTFLKTFCGSPHYAAPEILLSRPYVGTHTDSWSLAVVLYGLLTGTIPWAGNDSRSQLLNAINGLWTDAPTIPASAKRVFSRCFVVEPENRASIGELLSDPWFKRQRSSSKNILRRISEIFGAGGS